MSEFQQRVSELKDAIDKIQDRPDQLRLETIVESCRDWKIFGGLDSTVSWFLEQQRKNEMSVESISVLECDGWSLCSETGYIKRDAGDFFYVQGVRVSGTSNREVSTGWSQPIVTQVGYNGGILGLLRGNFDGVPHYLVEAKAEPGNPDGVQISPTLQATHANICQDHGGSRPRYTDLFLRPHENECTVLFDQDFSEDGGRLYRKRNRGMLVQIAAPLTVQIPDSFRWISLYEIKMLLRQNSWVGPHVRSLVSHL